jgi:hypothetical protein
MKAMATTTGVHAARWYRSFYFRIGASFVVLVVAVVVAQSAIFSVMVRAGGGLGPRPPNILAAIIAADVGAALAQDPNLDLPAYIAAEYGRIQTVVLVMKDGTVASNRADPLADGLRRSVDAVLAGKNFGSGGEPKIEGPPVVTAPGESGFRVQRSRFWVLVLGSWFLVRVLGSGFGVRGSGSRVRCAIGSPYRDECAHGSS